MFAIEAKQSSIMKKEKVECNTPRYIHFTHYNAEYDVSEIVALDREAYVRSPRCVTVFTCVSRSHDIPSVSSHRHRDVNDDGACDDARDFPLDRTRRKLSDGSAIFRDPSQLGQTQLVCDSASVERSGGCHYRGRR